MRAILIGGPLHGQTRVVDDTFTRWTETGLAGESHCYLRQTPAAGPDETVPVTDEQVVFAHTSLSGDALQDALGAWRAEGGGVSAGRPGRSVSG